MIKKLVQHGNSAALILDKPILELLNVTMDTPLEITTDGRSIVISPARSNSESEFSASLDKINRRFSRTLQRLGE
ncbi:MAG: AbrB/MazE/SpoVT family DNA-binding domain-containing protein [Spirochaetaceae bacterium]|nr:MAG: AbrB/MazE/SpoVT family DNA-binding domain-containing protein [Spirochaetaceae bacterium]